MFSLSIRPHSMASPAFLKQVIAIKNVAWPHSEESQLTWLQVNLKPEDLHCLLLEEEEPIGYINLVNERLTKEDGSPIWVWGVGNVCVTTRGKGHGLVLMGKINEFISITKRVGLLLCRETLVPFYKKCGWVINNNLMKLHEGIYAMTYNYDEKLNCKYNGRVF